MTLGANAQHSAGLLRVLAGFDSIGGFVEVDDDERLLYSETGASPAEAARLFMTDVDSEAAADLWTEVAQSGRPFTVMSNGRYVVRATPLRNGRWIAADAFLIEE